MIILVSHSVINRIHNFLHFCSCVCDLCGRLIKALITMMGTNVIGPINLGNPSEYTILELAGSVQKVYPSPVSVFSLFLLMSQPLASFLSLRAPTSIPAGESRQRDLLRSAALRRSEAPLPRHHEGQEVLELGTQSPAPGRAAEDRGEFPRPPEALQRCDEGG